MTITLLISTNLSLAQGEEDIVRLSAEGVNGTARTIGIGGAQSVLGADMGAFHLNPANLGLFRSSQVAISGDITGAKTDAVYGSINSNTNQQYSTLNNFGAVFSTTDDTKDKIKSISLGFSYHRRNNFVNDFTYEGLNELNSFTTYLGQSTSRQRAADPSVLDIRKIIDPIENVPQMAWKSELIKDPINDSIFEGAAEYGGVMQSFGRDEAGYHNDWDIGIGTNYSDFLYVGASVGIQYHTYGRVDQLTETDDQDTIPNFVSYTYQTEYQVEGSGSNLKLGAIVRPLDFIRIGVGIETPITYSMEAVTNIGLLEVLTDDDSILVPVKKDFVLEEQRENIEVVTPLKLNAGLYVQAGKYGFVSVDLEQINYANAKHSSAENNNLRNTTNLRVGLEGRYNFFYGRLGAAFYGSPYNDENVTGANFFTVGAGYKTDIYFFDVAFLTGGNSYQYSLYDLEFGRTPLLDISSSNQRVTITLGSKF